MMPKPALDRLYRKYNRREYVHPDPLEFLFEYPDPLDREIVGLLASSLAYGRVAQILKSVRRALEPMGASPRQFVEKATPARIARLYTGFCHRMTGPDQISSLLAGIRRVVLKYGSLNACFMAGLADADVNVLPALSGFVRRLDCPCNNLLPSPEKGSACKRLNLYLRWMVRNDAVDPGGWCSVKTHRLIVPLDTHMAQIGRILGFTKRASADMKTALEITDALREFCPEDPVKYDFALTRLGIHPDGDYAELGEQPDRPTT